VHGETLLVVPDANILLQDLGHACRKGHRTTLINAANTGALRLFCAHHVVDEVFDHSAEHAAHQNVPHDVFLARWRGEYLPVLRMIPRNAVPEAILTDDEQRRIRHLLTSKDVPSVMLALALRAFYLTEDQAARWAVYDTHANAEELLQWLDALRDGGSADELAKAWFLLLLVPTVTIGKLGELFGFLARTTPWSFLPIVGGLGVLLVRTPLSTYRRIGSGLGYVLEVLGEVYRPYQEKLNRFRAMAPDVPTWAELKDVTDRRAVLLRACLWTLARAPDSNCSAAQLARKLPPLGVGQGPQLVLETLRSNSCFSEPYKGRWQVGHVAQLPLPHEGY
jgi:predicted nucleic acid-binding protein